MPYVLTILGLILLLFRESDALSSDWKTILLGVAAEIFVLTSALVQNMIDRNKTRIENLEKEIEKLKGEEKNNERN